MQEFKTTGNRRSMNDMRNVSLFLAPFSLKMRVSQIFVFSDFAYFKHLFRFSDGKQFFILECFLLLPPSELGGWSRFVNNALWLGHESIGAS